MYVPHSQPCGEGLCPVYVQEAWLTCWQAILSQFSKSKKAVSVDGDGDDDDDADAFAELEDDEEVDEDEIEAANEVDPDREASDRATIEEVAQKIDKDLQLSQTDINLGCFALTKVRSILES